MVVAPRIWKLRLLLRTSQWREKRSTWGGEASRERWIQVPPARLTLKKGALGSNPSQAAPSLGAMGHCAQSLSPPPPHSIGTLHTGKSQEKRLEAVLGKRHPKCLTSEVGCRRERGWFEDSGSKEF